MAYTHLPFEQYFINTSEDYSHTGRSSFDVHYASFTYRNERFNMDHEVNYEIHYEPERNVIQLNFQATSGLSDWFVNVVESSVKYYTAIDYEGGKLQLRVHHGWGDMYRSIKHTIRDMWKAMHEAYPDAETEIVGWSLGAGQAILCAQDLNFNFRLKSHLITFGTVSPFTATRENRQVMQRYLNSTVADCWNFADVNDIITYMPPSPYAMMIHRVNIGTEKLSLIKIMQPVYYHTRYDRPELYEQLDNGVTVTVRMNQD